MVHRSKLKALPHWAYLGFVGFLGAYAYSFFHNGHPLWTDAARFGVFPLLQASGALGWLKMRAAQFAHVPAPYACRLIPTRQHRGSIHVPRHRQTHCSEELHPGERKGLRRSPERLRT